MISHFDLLTISPSWGKNNTSIPSSFAMRRHEKPGPSVAQATGLVVAPVR